MSQLDLDLRWQRRRPAWRRPPVVFNPRGHSVDVVPEGLARLFVQEHHYAGEYPAARLAVGLWGPGTAGCSRLLGAAVYSVPMNQRVIPRWAGAAGFGEIPASEGAELGRLVLLDDVAYNGESWFIARANALARCALALRVLVSYADPEPRETLDGLLVKRAHYGTIYRATNARQPGRSKRRKLLLLPSGQVLPERALSKIRAEHKGWVGAARRLVEWGAPPRRHGEDPAAWLVRALPLMGLRVIHHPGNLVYVFDLRERGR